MKGVAAVIGVFCLAPLLLAGTAAIAAATTSAAQNASCTTGGADIDTEAVAQQVASILGGKGTDTNIRVEGLDLPDEQIPNAKTIVATGIALKVPARGRIVALATALQESRLRNLNYGDRDSLGLFQQRPSQGWGTPEQIRDPVYASTKFYTALLAVDGWQQLTVAQAAQAVQKSALPGAYAQWEDLADALQRAIVKILPSDTGNTGASTGDTGCTASEDGSAFGTIPAGTVPAGYSIPKDAPATVRTALRWAMGQLGTPYQWGGSCTDSHGVDPMGRCDCSSLMQLAYAAAGVPLTRTTKTQVHEGNPVSVKHLKPGDLLFTEGTAAAPDHVGMYMGSGLVIAAPHTGSVVRIEPIKDWQILAARRIVS
ncbi:C40 family peptidase [Streptomyces sp. NBC_01537]|uniref:C40 family peptidase n=1 Tax=Streptomyces sp. NBC_01537 TaxID=2903896 RepID=UPI003869169E